MSLRWRVLLGLGIRIRKRRGGKWLLVRPCGNTDRLYRLVVRRCCTHRLNGYWLSVLLLPGSRCSIALLDISMTWILPSDGLRLRLGLLLHWKGLNWLLLVVLLNMSGHLGILALVQVLRWLLLLLLLLHRSVGMGVVASSFCWRTAAVGTLRQATVDGRVGRICSHGGGHGQRICMLRLRLLIRLGWCRVLLVAKVLELVKGPSVLDIEPARTRQHGRQNQSHTSLRWWEPPLPRPPPRC